MSQTHSVPKPEAAPVAGGSGDDRGQSTIEVALALPIVVLMVLIVVQVAVIVGDALRVQLAAREGARIAAVAASPHGAAARAAHRVLDAGTVAVVEGASTVTVTVTYRAPTDVPLIGALLPDVELRSQVTMALEPP